MENQNGNQQSETFFRYRNVIQCLSAGISFLTDNFLYLVKVSLPFALTYSIILSAIAYICSNSLSIQTILGTTGTSGTPKILLGIILIVLMLLLFITEAFFTGFIYRLIHIHSHNISIKEYSYKELLKSSLSYSGKAFVFYLVVFIYYVLANILCVIPLLLGGEGTIITVIKFGAFAVLATLALVFALPFSIALPAMYFGKRKAFRNAIYGYKKGFKFWGKVFCLSLLVGILSWLLVFVLSMPSLTMMSAFNAATFSQLNGDSVHLPGGYGFFYVIVLLITYYLYSFLHWLMTVPFSYLYASIKTDELEEAKNQLMMPLD